MKDNIKKIILLFIGVIVATFCLELVLNLVHSKILLDKVEHEGWKLDLKDNFTYKFFEYLYVDIYNNYYKLDNDEIYRVVRKSPFTPDAYKEKYFQKQKHKDTNRIFIIGESVAENYPKELLENNLKKFIAEKKFEVINAGTGSYESLRVSKILKEIVNYSPDYIIVLVGNNDGIFNPIEINYFPYKYKIFRRSIVLNRLSNYFIKREYYDFDHIQPFFEKNVLSMVKRTKNICPIFFVTLPHNLEWSCVEDISGFFKNFPFISKENDGKEKYFINRRNFLKSLPKLYSHVHIVDYDKELKKYVYPGYKVFTDNDHYYSHWYDFISRLFIEKTFNINTNINEDYFNNLLNLSKDNIVYCLLEHDYNLEQHPDDYDKSIKLNITLYFLDRDLFLKTQEKMIKKKKNLQIISSIYVLVLYDNDKDLLFKYMNKADMLGIKTKEYYLVKTLAYIKYKNIQMAKKYFNLAKELDEHNEININFEELKNVFNKK